MKTLFKVIIISVLIIVSPVLILFIYETYRMPFNDLHLRVFQYNFNKFISLLHPKESKLIAEAAEIGNWADGTYCQFLVGQFRLSSLSKEELEKIYPYDFLKTGIYFIDSNEVLGSSWLEWREKYLKDYKQKDGENIYLIWAVDDENPPDGDIRCD
ncbi:MAG: hypothetical protein A2528_02255 [Candidatus Staskawiczbacteria bacterium RIFOXYD2_FULL_37_9]|uniref:Uncharacterized protein n=1 Tax=Candidatus Staskawiczbacteria bacterium RIFOXYB1_FULL_37_44 TaxID=1802223 RepID=A0A1G2IWV6_9BACT|nr:MAG: hypothetical protein A2358_01045 [Candidatus Staskawiczbacteria bacterium RIFOXYB1_FULL_37_44]OGZ84748.1 MAG: hypothetical protein A2416_01055 [Candidatus Staskawiczbacteria bacterium RIFOXYC1_FULL_37_52]OGZ88306.1 MAG: hypothetical protein A2444_03625 [Candidatus Staskawiczbacteria bacterium RIFOXYC2_FULL_37_19]OGZ90361.1 MAG: hypothetical protein A2581_01015 [Candidatus Staskawiczbacteria bacterium RIFOXYD1_FULL_37_110]OGZ92797.1 MAG: hypothetical protein A2528_02255 [Candidatus Stask